jgi:hypothetical protein
MNDVSLIGNNATDIALGADNVAAATGALDGAEIGLIKDDIEITRQTTFAELDAAKATFTGYAAEAVTWGAATISDDGHIEYLGSAGEFRPTGTAITNGIYGFYVIDGAGTGVLFAARFPDAPLPMESALDMIRIDLRFRPGRESKAAVLS